MSRMAARRDSSRENASLKALSDEAFDLYSQAEKYRELMNALAQGDPQRNVYESIIRDMLARAERLAAAVKDNAVSKQ